VPALVAGEDERRAGRGTGHRVGVAEEELVRHGAILPQQDGAAPPVTSP
jgi:hypothetical protein